MIGSDCRLALVGVLTRGIKLFSRGRRNAFLQPGKMKGEKSYASSPSGWRASWLSYTFSSAACVLCLDAGLEEAGRELESLEEQLAASRVEMQRYENVLSHHEDTVDVWTEAKKTLDEIQKKGAEAKRLSALLPHLRLHERRVEHSQCTELLGEILAKLKVEQAAEEDAAKHLSALGGRRTAEQIAKQQEELQAILDELQQLQDRSRRLHNNARRLERERTEKEDAWRDEETLQKKVEERLRLAQEVISTRFQNLPFALWVFAIHGS